jgi:hypothetical protein
MLHLLIWVFAACTLVGCIRFGSSASNAPASIDTAETFLELLTDQIKAAGLTVVSPPSGGGGSGGSEGKRYEVLSRSYEVTVPKDAFPASQLYDVAQIAVGMWGEREDYGSFGFGGGRNRFQLHFGDHETHAFISVVAWEEDATTKIHVYYGVFE